MGYRIKTVAERTGVPRNTLLAWERRYELVHPERLANGYRSYSEADVQLLQRVKDLVDQGHAISEAVSLVRTPPLHEPALDLDRQRQVLLGHLLDFDHEQAVQLTTRLGNVPFEQLLDVLYLPVLRELGEGWSEGRYTVAQEHFASAFIRERMTAMLSSLEHRTSTGPRALLACLEGERHELGLMATGLRLALRGWRITWLGAEVPTEDLVETVAALEPELVVVATIQPAEPELLARSARRARAVLPLVSRLVYGGDGLPAELPDVPGVEWLRNARELRV